MSIEGLIASREGENLLICGFTGTDLECEGCEAKTGTLYETEDSVFLCQACWDACVEESKEPS